MQCSVALFGLSSSAHCVGGKGDYPLDYPGGADTADRCPVLYLRALSIAIHCAAMRKAGFFIHDSYNANTCLISGP